MMIKQNTAKVLLLCQVLGMFCLSIWGRKLQYFLAGLYARYPAGTWVFAAILLAVSAALLLEFYAVFIKRKGIVALHFMGLCSLIPVAIILVVAPVEYLHVALYGALLVLSVLSFASRPGTSYGVLKCLLFVNFVSFLEESVQGFTADRIFDLRDLLLNLFGSICGLYVIWPAVLLRVKLIRPKGPRTPPELQKNNVVLAG